MAWTELTRRRHARVGGKYAGDLTDAEWAVIAPLMPPLRTTGSRRVVKELSILIERRVIPNMLRD